MVTNRVSTIVEESLNDILRKAFHNGKNGISSVEIKVVEQVMPGLVRWDITEETLDTHITKFSDNYAAAKGLSEQLLASSSFMAPIEDFV